MAKPVLLAMGALLLLLVSSGDVFAQCAMCRTALLNSPEGQKLASGFNTGILVLLSAPFLVVGTIAFLSLKRHLSVLFWRAAGRRYSESGSRRQPGGRTL